MTGWVAGEEARDTPLGMTGGVGHDVTAKFARARQGPKSLTPEGVSYMDFDCGSGLHRREVLRLRVPALRAKAKARDTPLRMTSKARCLLN